MHFTSFLLMCITSPTDSSLIKLSLLIYLPLISDINTFLTRSKFTFFVSLFKSKLQIDSYLTISSFFIGKT